MVSFSSENNLGDLDADVRFGLWIQSVDATHWLNRSAGVSKFNVSLGLSLSRLATANGGKAALWLGIRSHSSLTGSFDTCQSSKLLEKPYREGRKTARNSRLFGGTSQQSLNNNHVLALKLIESQELQCNALITACVPVSVWLISPKFTC